MTSYLLPLFHVIAENGMKHCRPVPNCEIPKPGQFSSKSFSVKAKGKFSLGNLQRPQWFSTVPEVPRIWSAPKDHLEIKFIWWKTSMLGDFRTNWSWPKPSSQCSHLLECTLSEGQIREHTEQKYRNRAMSSKLPSTLYWYIVWTNDAVSLGFGFLVCICD